MNYTKTMYDTLKSLAWFCQELGNPMSVLVQEVNEW